MAFDLLLREGRIITMALRNRLITGPMEKGMANHDGSLSQRYIAYLTERARGGASLPVGEPINRPHHREQRDRSQTVLPAPRDTRGRNLHQPCPGHPLMGRPGIGISPQRSCPKPSVRLVVPLHDE